MCQAPAMPMWPAERQSRLRLEAMHWLSQRTHDGAFALTSEELREFRFEGAPFALRDRQRGIRKPAGFTAALSITTVHTPAGGVPPYLDADGVDGLPRYKWRGQDPEHPENRALRAASKQQVPLIWFYGVGNAVYEPRFPVFLQREEPAHHQFVLDLDVARGLVTPGSVVEETLRRYIVAETRKRLHQPVFRAQVMRAYGVRCCVCALGHAQLLDAAHIVPDSEEHGIAAVTNGLALCKIHHAAFDAGILGIRPDLVVQIRSDLLDEVDGPMLRYGLQERHGQRLMALPSVRREHPDPVRLQQRWRQFEAVG